MLRKISYGIFLFFLLHPSWVGAQNLEEERSPLYACWSSPLLSGKKNETTFLRGVHTFDTPTADQEEQNEFFSPPPPLELQGPIRRVHLSTETKFLALTFDLCEVLGEVAGYDGALVDYLRANHIKATFFAGGKWMRSHSERAQQLMLDPLFELANHSEAHRNLRLLKNQPLRDEIRGPQNTFLSLRSSLMQSQCIRESEPDNFHVPERLGLFRFPFGACNETAIKAVNDEGFLIVQWDISLGDPVKSQTAQAMATILLKAKPGSIIIGHANGHGYNTAEALKIALPQLHKKGFEFVTVSELLKEGIPEIASSCYNIRPGDTDKYDTFFKKSTAKLTK